MGKLLGRYGIRRIFANGAESKVTSCGDGTFSVVIYRKGRPPEYHLELMEEAASRLLRDFTYTLAEGKHPETS